MPKNTEEDTSRTVAEPAVVATASRDEPEAEVAAEPGKVAEVAEVAATEVVETVELEQPAAEPLDYEDTVANEDDPRLTIAKKHDETQRQFDTEGMDEGTQDNESVVESSDLPDIIDAGDLKDEFIEVKIYDEVRRVSKSKVDKAGGVQAYQKQVAVAEGFQRNATRTQELDERENRIKKRELDTAAQPDELPTLDAQQVQTTNPDDPPAKGDQSLEKLLTDYHEALLEGDDDLRDQLALKLHKRNSESSQPLNMDTMIDRVADKAADKLATREADERTRQRLIDTTEAADALIAKVPKLQHRHKDFDRLLYNAINDETDIIEREHPDWEPAKVIAESWNKVKSWKGGTNVSTMSKKQEQKRGMNRPLANSGRNTPAPADPVRTDSDYVTDLKKSRGQA
jgi:hypothetical protein